MKTIRLLLASVFFASLFVAQLPTSAPCQMICANNYFCTMPCCKTKPMPNCPHVRKASPPRDIISASASTMMTLHAVAHFCQSFLENPLVVAPNVFLSFKGLKSIFLYAHVTGRSPPQDSALQYA